MPLAPPTDDLRPALLALPTPLEVVARNLLGGAGRIAYVVRDPEGRVGLVQPAAPGRDLETWAALVGELSWLAPRIADWAQLAPERRLDPSLRPRALLVAERFEERTRLAAGGGSGRIELWRLVRTPAGALLVAEDPGRAAPEPNPPRQEPRGQGPAGAFRFRSRLRDGDL